MFYGWEEDSCLSLSQSQEGLGSPAQNSQLSLGLSKGSWKALIKNHDVTTFKLCQFHYFPSPFLSSSIKGKF
jgi:hypothetical protein